MRMNRIGNWGAMLVIGLGCVGMSALPARAHDLLATGGDSSYVTNINGTVYGVHIFTSVGTTNFTPYVALEVEYLIVAGGGGGSAGGNSNYRAGGGGGAGDHISGTTTVSAVAYPIGVGAGGAGGVGENIGGNAGENSTAFEVTALGGGGGGPGGNLGLAGGSSGGSGRNNTGQRAASGSGNSGGGGSEGVAAGSTAGGGGGAGSAGGNAVFNGAAGAGGNGLASDITGVTVTRAGGGGGGAVAGSATGGTAGSGGAGAGGKDAVRGGDANANTGSGGGGSGGVQSGTIQDGGNGGSGIVVIRYILESETPVIFNQSVTDVTTTGAVFTGYLASTGASATAVSVYWGEDPDDWANTNTWDSGDWDEGSYPAYTNSTLVANKTYYYTFGATNDHGGMVALSPIRFITGEVSVEATVDVAQYPTNGLYTISRPAGTTAEPLTVYFTMSGEATEDDDYTLSHSGSVTIPAGETNATVTLSPKLSATGTATLEITAGHNYPVSVASGEATVTILPYTGLGHVCVVPTGQSTPTEPYDTWATAADNIQTAIDAAVAYALDTVVISNGTYNITTQISIANGITVRSIEGGLAGAAATIVQRSNAAGNIRVIFMNHADAVLQGLTIRNGRNQQYGTGVRCTRGTIRHCIIRDNQSGVNSMVGIGVYLAGAGAVLEHSIITNNTWLSVNGYNYGAGVGCGNTEALILNCVITGNKIFTTGGGCAGGGAYRGTLRNCLLAWNASEGNASYGGGGARESVLENCTVVYNTAVVGSGGGVQNCTVRNSIVVFNSAPAGPNRSGGSFTYTCTTPLPAGEGNIDADPHFRDAEGGDYRPVPGAPVVDTGTNLAWMAGATDLDGNPRVGNDRVDMGAYERDPSGALECGFTGTPRAGLAPLEVEFTAYADGDDTTGLYYRWDFDNNGIVDAEGSHPVVTNIYSATGAYSVSLTVSNAGHEVATAVRPDYVKVSPLTLYVAPGGNHTVPYATWETAANDIQTAIDFAFDDPSVAVVVSNGTYNITEQIDILKGITVRGIDGNLEGAESTIVQRSSAAGNIRVIFMNHADAVLQGLTIRNGRNQQYGTGVRCTRGTIRHCIIRDNQSGVNSMVGIGVYLAGAGAVLEHSIITNNTWLSVNGYNYGAGVGCGNTEALVLNCVITGNKIFTTAGGCAGGGAYRGTLRNCLLAWNASEGNASYGGGGARESVLENCTVVYNTAVVGGGGGVQNCTVRNSIVVFNSAPAGPNRSGGSFTYTCTTSLPAGEGNIDADPLFVDAAGGDFRLQYRPVVSPAIDAGLDQEWMIGATDLAGEPRIQNQAVDMGAYEIFVPPAGSLLIFR